MEESKFLTAGQVSQLLGIPRRTVSEFARKGRLPTLGRYGNEGHFRFHREPILRLAAQQADSQTIIPSNINPEINTLTGHLSSLGNTSLQIAKNIACLIQYDRAVQLESEEEYYILGNIVEGGIIFGHFEKGYWVTNEPDVVSVLEKLDESQVKALLTHAGIMIGTRELRKVDLHSENLKELKEQFLNLAISDFNRCPDCSFCNALP